MKMFQSNFYKWTVINVHKSIHYTLVIHTGNNRSNNFKKYAILGRHECEIYHRHKYHGRYNLPESIDILVSTCRIQTSDQSQHSITKNIQCTLPRFRTRQKLS